MILYILIVFNIFLVSLPIYFGLWGGVADNGISGVHSMIIFCLVDEVNSVMLSFLVPVGLFLLWLTAPSSIWVELLRRWPEKALYQWLLSWFWIGSISREGTGIYICNFFGIIKRIFGDLVNGYRTATDRELHPLCI